MGAFSLMFIHNSRVTGFGIITQAVWRCYCHLSLNQHGMREIPTCIQVTIIGEQTTMETIKRTKGIFTKTTTFMADLAGHIRIDLNNFNSFSFSFVLDKTLQLIETPVTQYPIKDSSSSFVFLANSFEVFHNNFVSIKIGNNILTNVMVSPSHKPFLSTRDFFKQSLSRPCAFSLEFRTQILELPFNPLDFSRPIKLAIRSDSKIINSDINTKNSILEARAIDINVFRECKQEETSTFFIYPQEAFSNFPSEILPITIWNSERDFNPTFDCSQTQDIILKGSRTREIISHTDFVDYWFTFSLLDHTTGLFDTSDSELALQSSLSQGLIDKGVELDIIPYLFSPCSIDTELQTFGINFKSSNYLFSCIDSNFGCCSCFHSKSEYNCLFKCIVSPPTDKSVGIRSEGVL